MPLFTPHALSGQPDGALFDVASSRAISPSDALLPRTSDSANIAFVDAGLDDIASLIQGLENTQVVLIDSERDGIAQITNVLATQQNLNSVQIFSHGENGALQLGDTVLSGGTIADYTPQLQQWRSALSDQADLMLYACNLASGEEGLALLSQLGDLTGADVAASDDLTGQGGDWTLEVTTGSIEAAIALSQAAQATYEGTLTILNNGDFEQGLSGWSPFTGTEAVSTSESFSGNASLQLSAAASGINQTLDAIVGETYTFTGHAKSSSPGYTAVGINFFDENYAYLGGDSQSISAGDWEGFQLQGTAVEGSRYVQFWAYKNDASGNFFVDNLVADTDGVTPPPPPPPPPPSGGSELLSNSGFESDLASWAGFTGTEAVSTSESFSGNGSLQLSEARSGTSQIIDVTTAGVEYNLSAYGKSSSANYVGFGINFFDENFDALDGGTGLQITSGDWQAYQTSTTSPEGVRYVQVWTYKSDGTGDGFLDDISLTLNDTTPPPPPTDTTAPTASLSASDVTAAANSYDFIVTYTDESGVDVSSLDDNDVRVSGPNGFTQLAELMSVNASDDGTPRSATYRITPPGGDWNAVDNGTYSIALGAGQVADTDGNTVNAATLGSFDVSVTPPPPTDNTAPAASLSASNVTAVANSYDFTVTYTDESGVDVSSLDDNDVRVNGPNGFTQLAELMSVNASDDGTPRSATYRMTPPGGDWNAADNGTYSVTLVSNQVADTVGNTVSAATLGSFDVSVTDVVVPGVVFSDDFETNRGWTTNPNNSDTATTGQWEVADPQQTTSNGITLQQGTTVSGTQALVTQAAAGNSVGTYDIDNGLTSVRSPDIVLADNADFTLNFSYAFGNLSNANNNDFLRVSVVGEQSSQVVLDQRGNGSDRAATWTDLSADISNFAGETVSLLVEAQDGGSGSLVEAAIDDVSISLSLPDTEAPSPSLNAPSINIEGTNTYDFEVTYSDNTAIDVSTIGTGDIRVTGPNGYNQVATFVGLNNNTDGTPRTATYRLNAPGGQWNSADNGLYNVFLEGNQVTDLRGNAVSTTAAIGDFSVDLDSNVLPLGNLFSGIAARDNATGMGYLMYSEELVDVRFLSDAPRAGNANNLVAVSYSNGQWFYDTDDRLVAFTPRSSDRLLAELDFSADTATLLVSTNQTINGIAAGYASGDLAVVPNQWNGNNDPGEFGISGTQVVLFGNGGNVPGQLTFNSAAVSVDENAGTVNLTVNRVGGSDGTVTVDYSTTDVSATAGDDFNATSGTLTFSEGQTQRTIPVGIINDTTGEDEEAFIVTLNNATGGASIGLGSTVVNINENDGGANPVGAGDLLPDLIPIVSTSSDYRIDTTEIPGQVLLRLSTEIANIGDGPLELWGTATNADSQPVTQRIYDDNGGFRDVLAGEFVNHPSHGHIHFEGFAVYNLREINADGSVGAIVGSGGKTSFCLINIRQPFPELTASAIVADGRGGDNCGLIQGVDVGYADVYGRSLPDQWVNVTNIPDGEYWLEVTSDPDNNILETDETNNTDYLRVTLDNPRFA